MKKGFLFFVLLVPLLLNAQFVFEGQVAKTYANGEVYLSFVNDYRKTSRIYLDQIISETTTDSLGNFSFRGNNLPEANGIYRIQVDKCADEGHTVHFLQECPQSVGILFIANNRDTLALPLTDQDQSFCSVVSTNHASEYLLEVEALKEEMILDFLDHKSDASKALNFEKWFSTLQDFGLQTDEPLVEIYIHDFLSDRKNETHDYYLSDLASNTYYEELGARLQNKYPRTALTKQYGNELKADLNLMGLVNGEPADNKRALLIGLAVVMLIVIAAFLLKRSKLPKKKGRFKNLTAQETKIASAILVGKSNKEIANELFISLSTVKTHINSIYKKLGVASRAEIKSKFQA